MLLRSAMNVTVDEIQRARVAMEDHRTSLREGEAANAALIRPTCEYA